MQTVAQTTVPAPAPYTTRAYHATLFTANVGQTGVALRDSAGAVFFQHDATGMWTPLHDEDASRLQLHGRTDLALSAAIRDGNLVVRCSRTVQRMAA